MAALWFVFGRISSLASCRLLSPVVPVVFWVSRKMRGSLATATATATVAAVALVVVVARAGAWSLGFGSWCRVFWVVCPLWGFGGWCSPARTGCLRVVARAELVVSPRARGPSVLGAIGVCCSCCFVSHAALSRVSGGLYCRRCLWVTGGSFLDVQNFCLSSCPCGC